MIRNIKSPNQIHRDGTSQQDRSLAALHPDYIEIEGRTIEDLILEAQKLAQEIRFYDEENTAVSTWEGFFVGDVQAYKSKSETEKEIQRKRWARQLAEYVENPERFQSDATQWARLSRPHVALFMAFLKLLNHVKSQINSLTKKHLDFYFLERLGFSPRAAVPDVVNVLLELANDVKELEVKEGTVLFGGTDEDGNDLHYTTDRNTVINAAEVAEVKTVFVEKSRLTIEEAHRLNREEDDLGFGRMVEMALGLPNPGDPLPALPSPAEELSDLIELLDQENTTVQDFLQHKLGFAPKNDFEGFRKVIQTHLKDKENQVPVSPDEWQEVYDLLDRAYKQRKKNQRQEFLKSMHENEGEDGFDLLLEHVYGRPEPGDSLPSYRGQKASILAIRDDLQARKPEATDYLQEELFLRNEDFLQLVAVSQNPAATSEEWEAIYAMLELANRKVRSIALPSPVREETLNIFSESDAFSTAFSQYGEKEESLRFKTFGGRPIGSYQPLNPAQVGMAVSSPVLALEEGGRDIAMILRFGQEAGDKASLKALFQPEGDKAGPVKIYLSSEEAWVQPKRFRASIGNFVVGKAEGNFSPKREGNQVTSESGEFTFDPADIGKFLVFPNREICEITELVDDATVKVRIVGREDVQIGLAPTFNTRLPFSSDSGFLPSGFNTGLTPSLVSSEVRKYSASQVYLKSLRVVIKLGEEDAAVAPISPKSAAPFFAASAPTIVLALNHALAEEQGREVFRSRYEELTKLQVDRVHIKVQVRGMRNLVLQNDQSRLDAKKPFLPFGKAPELGTSFYLAHRELSEKRLDSLNLELDWMNPPADLHKHYKNYWAILADDPELPVAERKIKSRNAFEAKVILHDKRAAVEVDDIRLFSFGGRNRLFGVPEKLATAAPTYGYRSQAEAAAEDEENVLNWTRYFRLELSNCDFQHEVHKGLFAKQARSKTPGIAELTIEPPYTPKLKSLKVGYTAEIEIDLQEIKAADRDEVFYVHPFGYSRLKAAAATPFLPTYSHEGALYLGIAGLEPPQNLSILFQMSEGSANPDSTKSEVKWSFLKGDEWVALNVSSIASDTTNGLMNTGIVQVDIPAEATTGGTLLPDTMHWLKVSCDHSLDGISDTIAIKAQAIGATFSSENVADSHFVNLLAPESITETLDFIPEISSISQPYTSRKGRSAEKDATFYNRISERLRHKNRAINMWDYERMVLNQFPEIYKVKCLPASQKSKGGNLGAVNVLVIPDIKGKLPFNPFEPKVSAETLFRVQEYLDAHAPAYADVQVRNPTYVQVMIRCVVKFKPGYNEGFYKPKLIDDLKHFLAPWAYDEGGKITIGGTIYASIIINYIAERPYIDYVANLKLFQSEDGRKFIDVRTLNGGKNMVSTDRPDTVLVSAQHHEIDIVDENGYDEENFEGINYMKVELDFRVGEDIIA